LKCLSLVMPLAMRMIAGAIRGISQDGKWKRQGNKQGETKAENTAGNETRGRLLRRERGKKGRGKRKRNDMR